MSATVTIIIIRWMVALSTVGYTRDMWNCSLMLLNVAHVRIYFKEDQSVLCKLGRCILPEIGFEVIIIMFFYLFMCIYLNSSVDSALQFILCNVGLVILL